jgi:hypothetical protein
MKAQGLPLNTIVLGALAVLVLVILAAAFVPSIRNVFLTMLGYGGDAYSTCESHCTALSGKWSSNTASSGVCGSSFCQLADLDADGDTDATGDTAAQTEYCPYYVSSCTLTTTDGVTVTVTADPADQYDCLVSVPGSAASPC